MRSIAIIAALAAVLTGCEQSGGSDVAGNDNAGNESASGSNESTTATVSPENAPPMSPTEQAAYDEAIECAATMESARALTEESVRGKSGEEAGTIMREVERLNERLRTLESAALGRGSRFGKSQNDVRIAYASRSFEISRERGSASVEDYARTIAQRGEECAARIN